jgi:hypothetical protein
MGFVGLVAEQFNVTFSLDSLAVIFIVTAGIIAYMTGYRGVPTGTGETASSK